MTFDDFENIISLLCVIAGLIYSVFKYIESPKRGYKYIFFFFLANFLSEYYWTVYQLVMRSYPNVSEFAAYLGWNIGYAFLLLAVFSMRREGAKRFWHPIIFLPVLINIPQFILYIRYGGILNNLWQVGISTAIMVFCLQDLVYYLKHREERKAFPLLSLLVLVYLLCQYGMWTASCFDWSSELLNPYFYCTIIGSLTRILFAQGVKKQYEADGPVSQSKSLSDLRVQVLMQTVISLVIIVICAAGFFTGFRLKNSLSTGNGIIRSEDQLVVYLFAISAVLILLVLFLLFVLTSRYRHILDNRRTRNHGNRSRLNFIITIAVTLALMASSVIYTNVVLYNSSVVGVYEDAEAEIGTISTELENYMTVAVSTLRVVADSVDLMERNGSSIEDIENYIVDQTSIQSQQFDENFTGIYAYINGEYLDGLGWVPPEGYEPTDRDWYKIAVNAHGEVVIVSPYVDAQTGSIVITIGKMISSGNSENGLAQNVVCLDMIVNHIQEVIQGVEIAGKGYGLVVNNDGFIIAHREESFNGQSISNVFDPSLFDRIQNTEHGRINASIDGEDCTLFVSPVFDQWYTLIVIRDAELLEGTYSRLAVNITVSFITFCLISFFYYTSYKNEQLYRRKVEEMNIQVVTALASAIDAKDNYTNGHSSRVAEYARMIAARAGYSDSEQNEIYMMGLLHDVGKIGVPDNVINKPSKLTKEEFELIKKHSVIGSGILESIKERPKLAMAARWHHERYGGGGYPDGISGEQIPEEARIIAVSDAYDAMTSRRSYRDIMSQDKVRSEFEYGMGTQFDPRFAKIMLQMIDEDRDYSMRENPSM